MKHVPHLLVLRPWEGHAIALSDSQNKHLTKVLRMKPGDPVSYTDGRGFIGEGVLGEAPSIARGAESQIPRPSHLCVAVAPPSSRSRQRFLVEKLSEMGVERLSWLRTRHGSERVAGPGKLAAWARAGLEQSRGGWLMDVRADLVEWGHLDGPLAVCEQGGGRPARQPRTVVVGPEGGWASGEVPEEALRIGLGPTVLRVETAAMVAATLLRDAPS